VPDTTDVEPTLTLEHFSNTADFAPVAEAIKDSFRGAPVPTTIPALGLLNLRGAPYTLAKHYMFEPMFRLDIPRHNLFKCCRQVGKSQNMCGSRLLRSIGINYYNTLFVCPRFEQIKRISNIYMKPLIQDSHFKDVFFDKHTCEQSILQRSFINRSTQFFSFAFLDAERIRSISCNEVCYDEVQDINWDFLPIIDETMSGQEFWRFRSYTGTPKTMENTIEKLWQKSSMAEWGTKCEACNYYNIASLEEDLMAMIGKTTVICAKCGKPINPDNGTWVHSRADHRSLFVGYHISQVTHPIHWKSEANWRDLLWKMETYPQTKFYNECLGESWDSDTRLITQKVLREISIAKNRNRYKEAIARSKQLRNLTLGIDWGGGGDESHSYTAIAIGGQRGDGDSIEIVYTEKLNRNMPPAAETKYILARLRRRR
jgi:hypothetical protein